MKQAEEIKQQLAEMFGCDPGELAGENIKTLLHDAEQYDGAVRVYWTIIDATIGDEEVFPS